MDYTIASIPTVYRGIKYRSRLEARWAAMFDNLGWVHVYEPFDLGKWSPDFSVSLPGEYAPCVLVEIKPITEDDDETLSRMEAACQDRGLFEDGSGFHGVLLLGIAPKYINGRSAVRAGWYRSGRWALGQTHNLGFGWHPNFDAPGFSADVVCVARDGWFSVLTGDGGMRDDFPIQPYPDYTMGLWKRAANAVQWHPK